VVSSETPFWCVFLLDLHDFSVNVNVSYSKTLTGVYITPTWCTNYIPQCKCGVFSILLWCKFGFTPILCTKYTTLSVCVHKYIGLYVWGVSHFDWHTFVQTKYPVGRLGQNLLKLHCSIDLLCWKQNTHTHAKQNRDALNRTRNSGLGMILSRTAVDIIKCWI